MFDEVVEWVKAASDSGLRGELRLAEATIREATARQAALLAEMERRNVHRADGHATMWGQLRATLRWSNADCKTAMRIARFVDRFPEVGEALHETWLSVANANELALSSNRVNLTELDNPSAHREFGELMRLAEQLEHDDLRSKLAEWEQRIAKRDATAEAEEAHECRNAQVRLTSDGGEVHAQLGLLDATEVAEILATYVDVEWQADWDAAVAEHGDDASMLNMPRTGRQRNADALLQIFRDAAASKATTKTALPVVNVHVDHTTFTEILTEAELLPERNVDPFDDPTPHVSQRIARTDHGHAIDHGTILRLLLDGYMRIVIKDDEGVPIRWGRARRTFEGAARDAVQSLTTRCTHPGCRVPTKRCQIDHTLEWSKGGLTDPSNGNPRCERHNLLKNAGFTVNRDNQARFHTHRPNGTEVC